MHNIMDSALAAISPERRPENAEVEIPAITANCVDKFLSIMHGRPGALFLSVLFLAAIFLITGCGGTSNTKKLSGGPAQVVDDLEAGRIQGTVSSLDSGLVIGGAVIETFENQAVAGNDGKYLLGPMAAGDYRVIARATGYSPVIKDAVRVLAGRITENIDFQLTSQTASYSPDFAVLALSPYIGTDGDEITVYCRGCGTNPGRVTFNDKDATIISWNSTRDDRIVVRVPTEVESGPVRVIIDNRTSNETQPQMFVAKPYVLRAEPAIASGGATIRVYGRNFNPIYRFNRVRLNGEPCATVDSPNSSTLLVTLPLNAKTGLLTVTIESDEYTLEGFSDVVVTITPELVYMSPRRSVPDVPLTLYGYNFGSDRSIVKVLFGSYVIQPTSFISFSDNRLSFKVPSNAVLAPGNSTEIRVQVNESRSNPLVYTAFNTLDQNLDDYGIYRFSDLAPAGTLKLARFRPDERIAFLSVLSGSSNETFNDVYHYTFAGYLGGNRSPVPTLPVSLRVSTGRPTQSLSAVSAAVLAPTKALSASLRGSLAEPAPDTLELYVRDFNAADPWDYNNDILATATLKATGNRSLVYLDINAAALEDDETASAAEHFDRLYTSIAASFGVDDPPEGNIDAQSRIVLFFTPLLDEAPTIPARMSYFDPRDKDPAQSNSAATEVIFASPTAYRSSPDEFYASLVESLHHMMYYNQKRVGLVWYGTDWQLAGLSSLARQTAGLGFNQGKELSVSQVANFLQSPENISLVEWPERPTAGNYGMQFLFTQYLFDRCRGYDAIKALHRGSNQQRGLADVDQYLLPYAYPATAGMAEFFHDFCLALYCDDLNLPAGFSGYVADRHQFKTAQLRGRHIGINGLRGTALDEAPVDTRVLPVKGFGCRIISYPSGNWGDLEVTISATPATGNFETWVIYYSSESVKPD